MGKKIDLNKSIHELCEAYPEIAQIMVEVGFKDIAKPGMLNTVGRFMTIPAGAQMKKLDLDAIKRTFEEKGFEIWDKSQEGKE